MNTSHKSQQIIDLLHKPLSLIRNSASMGIKGIKRFFVIVFLFAISNFILDIYAIVSFISADYTNTKLINLLLLIATGIAITAFAGYKAYQYLLINAAQAIYTNSKETMLHFCKSLVLKAAHFFNSDSFKSKSNNQGLQITKSFVEAFYEKQPLLIKKGFQRIFNRIPLAQLLLDLRTDIMNGKHDASAEKLFDLMNNYVTQNIFEANNTKWVGWMLPTNILLFYLWIDLVIG